MIPKVKVKSILNKHKRRDSWFLDEYSVNPYYGCQFSCIYCYTRGGTYGRQPYQLAAKVNAPELLERQLRSRARREEYGFIAIGTSTEPYMPAEEELRLTRKLLEIISYYRFPVHVLTKSDLVVRDIDLLADIRDRAKLPGDLEGRVEGSLVTFSASTVNDELASILEPGAPSPSKRLSALREMRDSGIQAGLALIPVIPLITDDDSSLREAIKTAKDYGADYIFVGALTLPGKLKRTFTEFMERAFPSLADKYSGSFSRSGYPTRDYQEALYKRAIRVSREVDMKMGILGPESLFSKD